MVILPYYPDFLPIALEYHDAVNHALLNVSDGVSEFTFANLYLFRKRYNYHVSFIGIKDETKLIISGERGNKKFFMTPLSLSGNIIKELFTFHDYWKNISESVLKDNAGIIDEYGIEIIEDRDNFDYLYLRDDLAKLSGKKFHKKRNLVNAFLLSHPSHTEKELTDEFIPKAVFVLEKWLEESCLDGDYEASREALELSSRLSLEGKLYFVNGHPAGYCLGESIAQGRIFAMHFEKAIDDYKGIYQYINQNFAETLNENCVYINREQDLGSEGLRQAKMTYRPAGFVKKYIGLLHGILN
jgi:hypothetical protein